MEMDAGWAEVLSEDDDRVLGRGRVIVSEVPAQVVADPQPAIRTAEAVWHGRLDSLHLANGAPMLARGRYRLRFEPTSEVRIVEIEDPADAVVIVHSRDGEL